MYARATQLEVDTLRVSVDEALARFRTAVLPKLREQAGYAGVLVLTNPEGKGLIVTLWSTAAGADIGARSYAATLAEHMTLFRSPPGRESYEVALTDLPIRAAS